MKKATTLKFSIFSGQVTLSIQTDIQWYDLQPFFFTIILSALEGPRQEGVTPDNLSSPPVPDVSRKLYRKVPATLLS